MALSFALGMACGAPEQNLQHVAILFSFRFFAAVSTLIETTHSECWFIHLRVFGFKCQSGLMSENTSQSDSRQCTTLTAARL